MKKTLLGIALVTICVCSHAADFAGNYGAVTENGTVSVQLSEADGRVQGTLTLDGYSVAIVGMAEDNTMVGELREPDGAVQRFQAQISGGRLNLYFEDGERVSLERTRAQAPNGNAPLPALSDGAAAHGQTARITVNGQPLTQEQTQQLYQNGIQVQPADYWYDPMCGAWGVWGGPTAGFVQPGIAVPPLPAHASNGNTGVHINGRIIAMVELLYLQRLAQGPIVPGQYWLDAEGNAGPVGGMAVINFLQAARRASGGGNSSWYGDGASGWSSSDGSGGVWIANPYGGTGTTVTY